jgi:hypothetical protein
LYSTGDNHAVEHIPEIVFFFEMSDRRKAHI